jgi:hypothetical protein
MTKPGRDINRIISGFESPTQTRDPKLETIPLRDFRAHRFGSKQNIHQFIERRIGALVHFFHLHRADRVLHDEHRMIRCTEGFLLRLRQRIEGVGDERDREAAALLDLD